MNKPLKVRFAPSPTGYLHIGGARTALFNYLYSKKNNGTFLLRIEDTDVKREAENSYAKILEDLNWLGISWDEGPVRQTTRLDVYKKYAEKLLNEGKAYRCYCTPEELKAKRLEAEAQKVTNLYNGKCRNLTPEEQKAREAEGRTSCLRFLAPQDRDVIVHDLIRGDVVYEKGFTDDFVIVKSDGTPSYNFAVVIDDFEMGVTLVMRGEEHLVNTPKQILLYEALGYEIPDFAHISMILAPDRSKMSKRHGTVAVGEYRNQGFLPEAIVNYIALLGWSPEGDNEFYKIEDMAKIFSLDRVAKNPAVYDVEKLKWMNAKYLKDMDNKKLLELLIPYMLQTNYIDESYVKTHESLLLEIVEALKTRLVLLSDVKKEMKIFFDDNVEIEETAKEALTWDTTPAVFDAFIETLEEMGDLTGDNFMEAINKIQAKSGVKGKKLYAPLRVAVSGQAHGVEMKYLLTILSRDQMIKRLKTVKNTFYGSCTAQK